MSDADLRHDRARATSPTLLERACEQGLAYVEGDEIRWEQGFGPGDVQPADEPFTTRASGGVLTFVKTPSGSLEACHEGLVYTIDRRKTMVTMYIDEQDERKQIIELDYWNGKESTAMQMAEAFAKCWTGGGQ